jgi:GMP synthase-like glutamine amidotransferase
MKPVAIIQHEAGVPAGTFGQFLRDRGMPAVTIRIDQGETLPLSAEPYAGICSLGGSMSVNESLPWIESELVIMRDADARGLPIIGHCLGGQLVARAFGGVVRPAEFKEMGWGEVTIDDPLLARDWLGSAESVIEVFHWHGDIFVPPPGARHLLSSALCPHQAFVIEREGFAHLGMQFHIEMTPQLVRSWVQDPQAEIEVAKERRRNGGPGVQGLQVMLSDLEQRVQRMQAIANRLYERWARALARV